MLSVDRYNNHSYIRDLSCGFKTWAPSEGGVPVSVLAIAPISWDFELSLCSWHLSFRLYCRLLWYDLSWSSEPQVRLNRAGPLMLKDPQSSVMPGYIMNDIVIKWIQMISCATHSHVSSYITALLIPYSLLNGEIEKNQHELTCGRWPGHIWLCMSEQQFLSTLLH